jgi:hypothetical protein
MRSGGALHSRKSPDVIYATRVRHRLVRLLDCMNATATMEMEMPKMEETELSVPLDLSLWVSVSQLREWIVADVATLNWTSPELMEALRQHPDFEPKALLNTMTLGYAIGIFTAEEIARRCSSDIEFRPVRPKIPPLQAEVKAFRKENRAVLKWSLAKVISRALKNQFVECESIDVLPPGLRRYVVQNATERLDIARHMDRSAEL